jgi:hypothetical protein
MMPRREAVPEIVPVCPDISSEKAYESGPDRGHIFLNGGK